MSFAQTEALINEYKGNLFEYMVANYLARQAKIEKDFLIELTPSLKKNLQVYQESLRKIDPDLFNTLPILAEQTASNIKSFISHEIKSLELVGKMGAHPDADYSEVDFFIKTENNRYPISLKLSKWGTATHTKSAGCKSLFKKYFKSESLQDDFNKYLEKQYDDMAIHLHTSMEIEYLPQFENWRKEGLTELPGELPKEQSSILKKYYSVLNQELFKSLQKTYQQNQDQFVLGIKNLLGFGQEDLVQVKCLYTHKENRYQFKAVEMLSLREIDFSTIEWVEPKAENSFFTVGLGSTKLQLRIKPMNKFTVQGFKVNCSINF